MADANVNSPAPKKRRSWLRLLLGIIAVFVVLLVVVYFVVTSSAFLKGVILPRAGKAMNANITVSDASISPFSQVILHDLKVQTTGTEPLVSAQEARLRYSLMDIIRGNIRVDEIAVVSPKVVLVQNPDGTSNLDPIMKAQTAQPQAAKPTPAKPSPPSKPLQVDIKKIDFSEVTLRNVKLYKSGASDVAEISHLNVSLDNIKNGQTGKFTVSANIGVTNNPPAPAPAGLLAAKVNGGYDFSLSPDLKPASVKGNTHLEITRAEGALAQAASLTGDLDCDLNSTEIKQVALHFQRGNAQLGQVRLSGPFDMEKVEGKLLVQLSGVDKQLLNLASAGSGLDFGPTTINSTNSVQVAKSGTSVSLDGQFNINQLQVTRTNQTTPPMDLRADYGLALSGNVADVRQCQLSLTPTSRARNQVQLTGHIDMSQSNAITGTLTLAADSVDVSTYYDLLAGQKPTPAKPGVPEKPSTAGTKTPASSGPEKEPDAMHFPVRNFVANASVHHFYLHELEIADLQANTKIDDAHIVLNPAKLTLNGAPLSATIDADLGVPGWKYSVAFNGQAVPLAPMVNSFLPDRKGILSGTLTAQGNVDGAGITGPSLQKALAAQVDVTSTNLNLSVDNIQGKNATTRLMKLLLDTISSIPDVVKGQATLGSLLSGNSATSSSGGNPSSTIKKSPINSIILHGKAGSGRVDLQEATIQSPSFQSQVTGNITLAAVLTNSTLQLPVSIWLERSVAEQIHLAGDTPTNATYAKLPNFLTFTGTLGNPKQNYDKGALATAALQAAGGKAGQAGNLMKGLGGLLGGSSSATNTSATNKPNLGGLKNLFK